MAVCELTGLAPSLIRPDIYPPGYIPRVIGGKAHSEPKAADKPAPADQVG